MLPFAMAGALAYMGQMVDRDGNEEVVWGRLGRLHVADRMVLQEQPGRCGHRRAASYTDQRWVRQFP